MKSIKLVFAAILILFAGCGRNVVKVIKVQNPAAIPRTDANLSINLNELKYENANQLAAFHESVELPSQLVDSDNDGEMDKFAFLIDLQPNESLIVEIVESASKSDFPQRAHAEVSEKRDYKLEEGVYTGGHFESVKSTTTPPGHIDHNYYYKMEGPGWESDKVGYRLYLDWRNSTDIFGKKVSKIVLPGVGHDKDAEGHDTYHTMADWGMDIFKVGNSLGIGTFGAWVDGKVVKVSKTRSTTCIVSNDGPILAGLNIVYTDWNFGSDQFTLNSNLSIVAGSRLTHYSFDIPKQDNEFCTGLAKHENTSFSKSSNPKDGAWNYIALWGNQSLVGPEDQLGIAVIYNNDQFVKLTEDELSYIVVLQSLKNKIDYYFTACWDMEPNGVSTESDFIKYLDSTLRELNNPLKMQFIDE